MASITSTGVGSGLDVNTIVSSLMSVEKRPLTILQGTASTLQTRISAYGSLQGSLGSLSDVATRLSTASNWSPLRVDSGDTSVVTATAAAGATAGAHVLEVEQLAQSQVLSSGNFASSSTVVGTGTLSLELGTTSGGVFTPRNGLAAVPLTIGSSNNTLAGIRDAINNAKAGVTASIVNGTGGAKLVLRTADGADSTVRLTAADDDGNATDASGLSALAWDPAAVAGAGRNLTQTQAAQDAKFTVDGVALTSASNTNTTAMDGVTLQLKKVTTGPVSLTVAIETMAVRKNVNDFINAYNAVNKLLQQQTQADPSGKNRGPLQADSAAVSVLNALRNTLRGSVTGATGVDSLNAAGIELQRDGSLAINEKRFAPLLDDPSKLARLFSQAQSGTDLNSRGFGPRFKQWASALTGDNGTLASRVSGLKHSVDVNSKQQDAMQDRLDRTEARIRAQYQRLDTQMATLNDRLAKMKSSLGLS